MSEKDLTISEMKEMQFELYEANKEKWGDRDSKYAKTHLLYMVEEMGECISIIKKKGIDAIMENQITPEEFSNAYIEKHNINMKRDFERDNKEKYNKKTF